VGTGVHTTGPWAWVRYHAEVAAGAAAPSVAPKFEALGLEECSGKYDVVTCIDVMIHYPTARPARVLSAVFHP